MARCLLSGDSSEINATPSRHQSSLCRDKTGDSIETDSGTCERVTGISGCGKGVESSKRVWSGDHNEDGGGRGDRKYPKQMLTYRVSTHGANIFKSIVSKKV